MTLESFSKCLQLKLNNSNFDPLNNNQQLVDALKNVFSDNLGADADLKKKVSFKSAKTEEGFYKKGHSPVRSSASTKKKTGSKNTSPKGFDGPKSELSDRFSEIASVDFQKFFNSFMTSLGKSTSTQDLDIGAPEVVVMENREASSEGIELYIQK